MAASRQEHSTCCAQGFFRVSSNIKDTALDCPGAEAHLASLSRRAVAAGLLDLDWVQQTTPPPSARQAAAPQARPLPDPLPRETSLARAGQSLHISLCLHIMHRRGGPCSCWVDATAAVVQAFKMQASQIVRGFFSEQDLQEAERALQALQQPQHHDCFVKQVSPVPQAAGTLRWPRLSNLPKHQPCTAPQEPQGAPEGHEQAVRCRLCAWA